ncbi:MAG: DUF2490 domain-containing protein [Alistipes sp.]|nr:DUF2490 domain-containing protein [Alistipes sp.]
MKRVLTTILFLCCIATASAQSDVIEIPLSRTTDNDLQGRLKVALEIPLSQKWQLTWSEEGRVKQNMGKMDVILSGLMVRYRPLKFLDATTEYALLTERVGQNWRNKHRSITTLTGKMSIGRFDLSLKELMMLIWSDFEIDHNTTPKPSLTMRTQLRGAYRNSSRWTPYAYAELFVLCNAKDRVGNCLSEVVGRHSYVSCVRLVAGSEMKINSKNRMNFYYMVNLDRSLKATYDYPSGDLKQWTLGRMRGHVIGVDYTFSL